MSAGQSGSRKRAKTGRESCISSSTRHTSAYDRGFEQHLIDNGIHMKYGATKPSNWVEIKGRMAQPRPSLSPSRFPESAFEAFQQISEEALTESEVMSKVFPIIAGNAAIPSKENLVFGNLKHLTDGSITKAQPDFYDGSRPSDLHKDVREKLGPYIVPSTNTAAPCLPNFFTEVKGPGGNAAVCKRQAMYDGALGARGVHELRSYINSEMTYDNNAYTITSTYHSGGMLTMHAAHPTVSENPANPTEYRMTQLSGWFMNANPDTFREAAGALRNARDWAKEKRDELIAAANSKVLDTEHSDLVSSTQSFSSLSNEPTHLESDSSADELALDVNTFASPAHRIPVRAEKNTPFKASST